MIRTARPDDFTAIQALYRQLFAYEIEHCDPSLDISFPDQGMGEQYLKDVATHAPGRIGIVWEEDATGVVKGYASLRDMRVEEYTHRKGVRPVQLQTLCVDQNSRGQGIGTALIAECKRIAQENGYTHMRVTALAKNTLAHEVYERAGFHRQEITHEMAL